MSIIFRRALAEIHRNADRIRRGLVNYIPFGLERFEEYIPGVQRKNMVTVTANSGVGKSKVTKFLYVIKPVDFILAHPEMNIKLKIFYFCLEESKEAFINSITCHKLYELHGLRVPIKELNSRKRELPQHILDKIDALEPYFQQFEEIVEIIDDKRYGYAIYQHVEQYMETVGHWEMKSVMIPDKERAGEFRTLQQRDFYVHDHPDHYVEVITDHISLLWQPKGQSLHETMNHFSSRVCKDLRDNYKCSVVKVQQQSADVEKKQYTHAGQSIEAKLEPSLDGLGDNKLTQRDDDEILGLFAPERHEIAEHRKYSITQLQDNYRSLKVLKARDGTPNSRIGLFFDGAINLFEELPPAADMKPEHYTYYLSRAGRGNAREIQRSFEFGSLE